MPGYSFQLLYCISVLFSWPFSKTSTKICPDLRSVFWPHRIQSWSLLGLGKGFLLLPFLSAAEQYRLVTHYTDHSWTGLLAQDDAFYCENTSSSTKAVAFWPPCCLFPYHSLRLYLPKDFIRDSVTVAVHLTGKEKALHPYIQCQFVKADLINKY